jgi:hypothetical protein
MPGVTGNPRGRPTNARLAAKRAALGEYAQLRRAASYPGMTPDQFVRLARSVYGKWWQSALARDLILSTRQVIRYGRGEQKIPHVREMEFLLLCQRRTCAAHKLARATYRCALAAERARQQLARMPRHKVLTRSGERRTVF